MSASAQVITDNRSADELDTAFTAAPGTGDLMVEALERAEAARMELIRHREKAARLEQENALLSRFLEDARRDFKLFESVERQLSEKLAVREEEIRALREGIQRESTGDSEQQRAREAMAAELTRLRSAETSLNSRRKDLESEIARLRGEREASERKLRDTEAQLEVAVGTIQSLKAVTESEESRIAQERDLNRRKAQFDRDERRLKFYSLALQREKKTVLDIAKALHARMQESRVVNPLKDYLDVTEFEARKVEVRLKTTPTISPERPALESAFARMLEQRDFLRKLLSASEREIDAQSAALSRIIEQESSACVPPPPPKVRDV